LERLLPPLAVAETTKSGSFFFCRGFPNLVVQRPCLFFSIAAHCCSNDSPVVFNRQVVFKAVRQNLLALVKGAALQHQSFFQVA